MLKELKRTKQGLKKTVLLLNCNHENGALSPEEKCKITLTVSNVKTVQQNFFNSFASATLRLT